MFAKPYKHKSNNTLKNSEKKHLAQRIQNEFGLPSDEKAKELVPMKGSCICMRVVLNSGDLLNVYAVDGVPMLIETAEGLVPTVCALWKVPDLVPTLNIHTLVLPKVQGGAPLYLPGVNLPTGGVGFPLFQIGKVLAARTEDNAAACLVGRAAMSSADMLLRASGVCLDTLHFYGDQLCKDNKFNKITRPKLAQSQAFANITVNLVADVQQLTLQPQRDQWPSLGKQEWPSLGKAQPQPPAPVVNEPRVIPEETLADAGGGSENEDANETIKTESSQVEDDIPVDMDELLRWCLLGFLRLQGKSIELPLKTNLLYKNHLHPLCPADRTLDVKKSSYKKVGKFLEAMQQHAPRTQHRPVFLKEGLLEVRELERGVSAVVAVNAAHPLVRRHRVPAAVTEQLAPPVEEKDYTPPQVREVFCVTASVQELLAPAKKGTALTPAEVRAAVNEYVKGRGLAQARGAVLLDATLAKVLGRPLQESVKWDALMSGVTARMTAGTELQYGDGSRRLARSRLEPVSMAVAVRSGNKKVTLVSNLEAFGFSLPALARECQLGAAATCGVTRSAAARADQLMLQGDQTYFVAKLLIEKYGLPKKFVEGADKALNKKRN